jgi:uncharacterized membrane protein YfcA
MTPLLILVFGIHPAAAVGTDMLYAAVTKTAGSTVHGFARTIDWRIVRTLAAGSLPATILILLILSHFDLNSSAARGFINAALGCALFFTAITLTFRYQIFALYSTSADEPAGAQPTVMTVAVGAILGSLVSISSVGAGALGVVAIFLIYPKLPIARIVGTDIAHAVPLTLVGGIGYWLLGTIDWHLLGSLLIGSLPGILVGSYFSTRVPEQVLRLLLSGTLIAVGSALLF